MIDRYKGDGYSRFELVKSEDGGLCYWQDVKKELAELRARAEAAEAKIQAALDELPNRDHFLDGTADACFDEIRDALTR